MVMDGHEALLCGQVAEELSFTADAGVVVAGHGPRVALRLRALGVAAARQAAWQAKQG